MALLGWLGLLSASAVAAQPPSPPPDLRDFQVFQFAVVNGTSPSSVLGLDNNGQIVRACVAPRTRDALRGQGVAFTESQLALLEALRLLRERDDGTLVTAMPIVAPAATERLRAATRRAAAALLERVPRELEAFRARLADVKRPRTAYTMLFSYVLDDLVWREWERDGHVGKRELSAEKPFWAGTVWAIAPRRAFSIGTNSIGDRGVTLHVNWTESAIRKLRPFVADPALENVLEDYVSGGAVVNPRAREVFGPYGIFDAAGRLTVPVVVEDGSDPLHAAAGALAAAVAREVPRLLELDGLAKELGAGTREAALVIAYHELMWDLMDELERRGVVAKPRIFADPASATAADVGDLVFVVRGKP